MDKLPRTLVLIAFGALIAAGITTAAGAKADPTTDDDARFLHALHNAGLVIFSSEIAINNAHIICAEAWRGTPVDKIANEVDAAEPNLDLPASQTVVAISLMIYCPNIGARS